MSEVVVPGRLRPRWKYRSIAEVVVQQSVAYRASTAMSVVLTFFWVVILYYMWRSAYAGQASIAGLGWDDMRTYIVLAFALNALVGWRVGSGMMATIRSGDVLLDFVRPLNYAATQVAKGVGGAVIEGIASLAITLVIGLVWLRISPPASVPAALLFVVAVVLGFLTKLMIVFLVSLLVFWTQSGIGLMWSQQAVIQILSGTIVPLALMPGWLRVVAEVMPMRGIASTPALIYLGQASGADALRLLGLQAGWLAVLVVLANLAWRRAFDAVEIQGG
ncbi:ABC transporter permease [Aestuariimicrobium soli]|uniref:ABC transporter permease n=1 Tax=Aestuariimicrobium soli TaxID=2035834 RepID=UPI003EBF6B07